MTSILSLASPALTIPALLAATILGGCASPNVKVGVKTRAETYDAGLDARELASATPPRLAMLPVKVGGGSGGFGPFANVALDRLVRQARAGETDSFAAFIRSFAGAGGTTDRSLSVYSVTEVANALNAADRSEALTSLLDSMNGDAIADRRKLIPIATALGVDHLMITWLAGVHTDNANRFSFAGLSFIRTGWTTVEIVMQLWHAPTGRLVWQSVGSGNIVGEGVVGTSPPLAESLEQILQPMLRAFLTGDSEMVVSAEVKAPAAAADPPAPDTEPDTESETGTPPEAADDEASPDAGSPATT